MSVMLATMAIAPLPWTSLSRPEIYRNTFRASRSAWGSCSIRKSHAGIPNWHRREVYVGDGQTCQHAPLLPREPLHRPHWRHRGRLAYGLCGQGLRPNTVSGHLLVHRLTRIFNPNLGPVHKKTALFKQHFIDLATELYAFRAGGGDSETAPESRFHPHNTAKNR